VKRKNPPMLVIGPLSIKSAHIRHAILNEQDFSDVRSDRVCNASMKNMTPAELRRIVPAAPIRPGSQDFLRYESKGAV
jgi:hypothetical protein